MAYLLRFVIAGNEVADWNAGLVQTALGRVAERRREAGRRSREVTMTDGILLIESDALTNERLEVNMSFNAKELKLGV